MNIPKTNLALFGRYDEFKLEDDDARNTMLGGISYKFQKSKVLFNIDRQIDSEKTTDIYEIALEIGF